MSPRHSPAFRNAMTQAEALFDREEDGAEMIGAEIPNQLQAVSDAIDHLEMLLEQIEGRTDRPTPDDVVEIHKNAKRGLANVLELARALRGGK